MRKEQTLKYRLKFLMSIFILITIIGSLWAVENIQRQKSNNLDKTIIANWEDSSTATRDYEILQNVFNTQKN